MKPNVYCRWATEQDAVSLAPRLRSEDRQECFIVAGTSTESSLVNAVHQEGIKFALFIDDQVEALFGVTSDGVMWFLGSDRVGRAARFILREAPHFLRAAGRVRRRALYNFAWAENRMHLKWCEKVGIHVNPVPVHIGGEPFFEVIYRAPTHV